MSLAEALFLGVVQGLTEFLPVSSSGHLVVFQSLMGMTEPQLLFDLIVHLGTLTAVLVYFRKEIFRMIFAVVRPGSGAAGPGETAEETVCARTFWLLGLSMLPTVGIAVVFKDPLEALLANPAAVGKAWMVLGVLLIASRWFQAGYRPLSQIRIRDALLIGVAQGIAVIPGISRSGSTIVSSLALGLTREAAASFSFLLSIPTILGATVFEFHHGLDLASVSPRILAVGYLSSAGVGFLVIHFLMRLIKQGRFFFFGFYCLAAGLAALIYFR